MSETPPEVYKMFRETVGDTSWRIVGAIAADKPHVAAMVRNVASIIDKHIMNEFEDAANRLKSKYPELADAPEFTSGFALRRFAYKGTSILNDHTPAPPEAEAAG